MLFANIAGAAVAEFGTLLTECFSADLAAEASFISAKHPPTLAARPCMVKAHFLAALRALHNAVLTEHLAADAADS